MDNVVLSYNDSIIYESDLMLLNEKAWLNDRIIGFVYEYFERDLFKENKNLIGFVNPSTVQFLKLCNDLDEARVCILEPLELNNKELLFFPLSDSNNRDTIGGCHWSLLVIDKKASQMLHYDSFNGSNDNQAKYFFEKYKSYFQIKELLFVNNNPQQKNGYDCGVYVFSNSLA
jgi:sentrin-specific protease 8